MRELLWSVLRPATVSRPFPLLSMVAMEKAHTHRVPITVCATAIPHHASLVPDFSCAGGGACDVSPPRLITQISYHISLPCKHSVCQHSCSKVVFTVKMNTAIQSVEKKREKKVFVVEMDKIKTHTKKGLKPTLTIKSMHRFSVTTPPPPPPPFQATDRQIKQ